MKKLTMEALEMARRRVFVRVDFNVPLKDGVVQEDTRIRATLPTLHRALDAGARIVLGSHLGRPKGNRLPELSLAPVAKRLSEHLGKPVRFCGETVGAAVDAEVGKLADGDVLLLENLRFCPGETDNDADTPTSCLRGLFHPTPTQVNDREPIPCAVHPGCRYSPGTS